MGNKHSNGSDTKSESKEGKSKHELDKLKIRSIQKLFKQIYWI